MALQPLNRHNAGATDEATTAIAAVDAALEAKTIDLLRGAITGALAAGHTKMMVTKSQVKEFLRTRVTVDEYKSLTAKRDEAIIRIVTDMLGVTMLGAKNAVRSPSGQTQRAFWPGHEMVAAAAPAVGEVVLEPKIDLATANAIRHLRVTESFVVQLSASAVRIQAAARRFLARRAFLKQRNAATVLMQAQRKRRLRTLTTGALLSAAAMARNKRAGVPVIKAAAAAAAERAAKRDAAAIVVQSAVRRLRAARTLNTLRAAAAQREARVQAECEAAAEALVAEVMAAAMAEEAERAAATERDRVLEDFRRTFAASKIQSALRRVAAAKAAARAAAAEAAEAAALQAAAQLEARVQAERAAAAEAAEEARVEAERAAAAAAAMEAEASRYSFGAPTLSSRAQRRRQNGAWAKKGKGKTIFPDSTPPNLMPTEASPYIPGSGSGAAAARVAPPPPPPMPDVIDTPPIGTGNPGQWGVLSNASGNPSTISSVVEEVGEEEDGEEAEDVGGDPNVTDLPPPPQTPFFDPAVAATPATGLQQPVLVTPAAFQPRAAAAAKPRVPPLSAPAGNPPPAPEGEVYAGPAVKCYSTAVAAVKEIKGIAADQELDGEEAIGIVSRIIENTAALKNLPGILNMTFWKQTRAVARYLWSKEHGDETPAAMTRRFRESLGLGRE